MPEFATLVVFAAACLALTTSPGPDMLLIASRSVAWQMFRSNGIIARPIGEAVHYSPLGHVPAGVNLQIF